MATRATRLVLAAVVLAGGADGLPHLRRSPVGTVGSAQASLVRRRHAVMTEAASAAGAEAAAAAGTGRPPPRPSAMPSGDALDKKIASLALPAVLSFLILPIAQATDLFWVGRMGEALAIAGQASANQLYSTLSWVTNTIPTITVPVVAKARAAGDEAAIQDALGEAIFISGVLGIVCTAMLFRFQRPALLAIGNPKAISFAMAYGLGRVGGVLFESLSLVGFAACRGVMDTVSPLKIALASNVINVLLDPLLIFTARMGILGAGLATAASQLFSAAVYLALLLRRKLVRWGSIFRIPSRAALTRLATAGGAVQLRSAALNLAFLWITKTVQGLDSTGTAAAAHAVTIQLWQLGGVVLFALSTVASIIIPAELNREGGGVACARSAASRLLTWGLLLGAGLGAAQLAALPLLGVFTPLPEVQRAAVAPSIIGAVLQLLNGVTFVGEGVMVGTQSFGALAAGQVLATVSLLVALHLAPSTLPAVWGCFWVFNAIRFANVMLHHFVRGPLVSARRKFDTPS